MERSVSVMSEFKGKLHETAVRFPQTHIWMDSCGEEPLNFGIERGIVGATSNPVIVGAVIKSELPFWEGRIKHYLEAMPEATEEDIAWAIIYEAGRERSKKLLPVFEESKGKKGRLSIQTNARFYRSPEKMLAQAEELNALGENMQVKSPTSKAGIEAFEEMTYRGISINATVSFTVPQAVAVAEAVERGLKRREAEGLPTEDMAPVCTIMVGRLDDWLKIATKSIALTYPEALEWAGVAVFKEAYRIYKERGYRTRLLSAAYRNRYHWSEFVGGDISMTIPYDWYRKINDCKVSVEDRMGDSVRAEYMEELITLPEFRKAFFEDGMKPEEFEEYGAFRRTIQGFISGYDDLLKLIRDYMVKPV